MPSIQQLLPRVLMPFLAMSTACGQPHLEQEDLPPPLSTLRTSTLIAGTDSFIPSGIASLSTCDILLVGAKWGSLIRLRKDGTFDPWAGKLPGTPQNVRIESSDGKRLIATSHNPVFWGVVNGEDLSVDPLLVPVHAWGQHWVGPVVALSSGRYAMAPIGDKDVARRQPERRVMTPLVQIMDSTGQVISDVDQITDLGGHYLSWLSSRLVLGNVSDTLLVVTLSDALLTAYDLTQLGVDPPLLWERQLPTYFRAPPAQEEVRTYPWIQIDGDLVNLIQASHIATATFGPNGKLYAIRNYMAEWKKRPNRLFKSRGYWEVKKQALEIYSARGDLLGVYALPDDNVNWLRVDMHGRLFLRHGPSSVTVARDPTSDTHRCQPLPTHVTITAADTPAALNIEGVSGVGSKGQS